MNLTKEYLAEQEDCIKRCQVGTPRWRQTAKVKERHKIISNFCKGADKILSVGSAGWEPIIFHCSHACDVHSIAGKYLKDAGWKGTFTLCSCDDLPFQSRFFDVAICQEVIEHLPDLSMVRKTFKELDRVARRWVVTTPAVKVPEKGHKRLFNLKSLEDVTQNVKCKIEKRGPVWYVFNNSS